MQNSKKNNNFLYIEGRTSRFPIPICYVLNIFTLGLYHILSQKFKILKILLETKKCNIKTATYVLATNEYGHKQLCKINKFFFPYASHKLQNFVSNKEIKYFESQCMRFLYDFRLNKFVVPAQNNNKLYDVTFDEIFNLSSTKDNKDKLDKGYNKKDSVHKNVNFRADSKFISKDGEGLQMNGSKEDFESLSCSKEYEGIVGTGEESAADLCIEQKANGTSYKQSADNPNSKHCVSKPSAETKNKQRSRETKISLTYKNKINTNGKIMAILNEYEVKKLMSLEKKYKMNLTYKKYLLTSVEYLENYIIYSENCTEQKDLPGYKIILNHLFNPFLIYNCIGMILWVFIDYAYYAFVILLATVYSLIIDIFLDFKRNKGIREIAQRKKKVFCYRNNKWVKIDTKHLFPGDVFMVDKGKDFPCDARLLMGEVIVDESFLTGETVPVFKSEENLSVLYAGTEILKSIGEYFEIECRKEEENKVKVKNISKSSRSNRHKYNSKYSQINNIDKHDNNNDSNQALNKNLMDLNENIRSGKAIAIVLTTRFNTAKGKLIKNILIPRPLKFIFQTESVRFILFTFSFSIIMISSIFTYFIVKKVSKKDSFCYSLDLLFCILSPALPATIWIGSSISAQRLKKKMIICNQFNRVNIAGKVDLIIFDKTGTLTEEGLDVNNLDNIDNEYYNINDTSTIIREALSSCHSIYCIDNELLGDPLDIKMFLYSESLLTSSKDRTIIIGKKTELEGPIFKEVLDDEAFIFHYKNILIQKKQRDRDNYSSESHKTYNRDTPHENGSDTAQEEPYNIDACIRDSPYINESDTAQEEHHDTDACNRDTPCNTESDTAQEERYGNNVHNRDAPVEYYIESDTAQEERYDTCNGNSINTAIENSARKHKYNLEGLDTRRQDCVIDEDTMQQTHQESQERINVIKSVQNILSVNKIHEFDNKLRRMSVVVKDIKGNRKVFAKGSPESIATILSEVPEDYEDIVKDYALDGYRIIAVAYKNVIEDKNTCIERNEAEKDLQFLCFIVFANKLKNKTVSALEELGNAKIKSLMATGDNILTAISVAKQAKLIDKYIPVLFPVIEEDAKSIYDANWHCIGDDDLHFDKIKLTLYKNEDRISYDEFCVACEGKEYEIIRRLNKEYYEFLLKKGVVFARMNSDQKKMLVEDLTNEGYTTCFCGDGANDCSALKSADIGIALADNEASIASSFTSMIKDISSVLIVLKEGRCALVTSFSRFQFIVLSSFVQCFSLYALSLFFLFLSDLQTAHNDLLLVLPFAYFMTEFGPNSILHENLPESRLLKPENIFYASGHFLIDAVFIVIGVLLGKYRHGSINISKSSAVESNVISQEDLFAKETYIGTVTFLISCFQIIVLGFIFTRGKPHSQSKKKMPVFIALYIFMTTFCTFLLFNIHFNFSPWINKIYKNVYLNGFEFAILSLLITANTVFTFLFEGFCDSKMQSLFDKNGNKINSEDEE